MLPTYRFYANDVLYGKLEKKFELVRDHFTMDITEGRLELTEYAASIGHNFTVTLNGRMLGAIMDDLELTIHNLVFDNAVNGTFPDTGALACNRRMWRRYSKSC